MALDPYLKSTVLRIGKSIEEFAREQGWRPDEYRSLFRINADWNVIQVFLVVKDFGGLSQHEMWGRIWDHLTKSQLTGPLCPIAVRLSIRDWNQIERGGSGGIPPGFVEQNELFAVSVAVD